MMGFAWEHLENERDEEQILERWKYVLDLYQEQPHLIDPHLDTILGGPKINIKNINLIHEITKRIQ